MPSASGEAYSDPRAHALRAEYLASFGGDEIPVPVRAIAEDLLGLRVEEADLGECSGQLIPAERLILLNAAERAADDGTPIRRQRFTLAHEIGHWVCHALSAEEPQPTYCRASDVSQDADRLLEREANIFAAELLMPEPQIRSAWTDLGGSVRSDHATGELASRFDVSGIAMAWRLYSYGLVEVQPSVAR